MEVAGAVTRPASLLLPCHGLDSSDRRKPCLAASVNVKNPGSKCGDRGSGNHRLTITCGEKKKEKRKLVKGLEKDLETFATMGFGIDPRSGLAGRVHGSLMKEAAEVLLRQLQWLRQAEKEAKRRRKQEKKRKSKSMRKLEDTAVEPPTESGERECEKSTDFNTTRADRVLSSTCGSSSVDAAHGSPLPVIPASPCQQESAHQQTQLHETGAKKVEVCMGKKTGGSQLLERFQQLAESTYDVSIVGCKCMGRCKNSPNVRLSTSDAAPIIRSRVQICDVDAVMSSFL